MIKSIEITNKYPQIEKATFKEAKELYSKYNILMSNNELSNLVFKTLGVKLEKDDDSRKIVNTVTNYNYPNEIAIKSSFVNNVLLKQKNQITIFELNVGECRADLCKINGKSTVYEIKTDLDNFRRLDKQIYEYSSIFEETYIICSEKRINEVIRIVPEFVGIYSYRFTAKKNYRFEKIRNATQSPNINKYKQLLILTSREKSFYSINEKSNINEVNKCLKLALKDRYKDKWNFLSENCNNIFEIDYQWFYKNCINPKIIYSY